jgi:hypothetical protein
MRARPAAAQNGRVIDRSPRIVREWCEKFDPVENGAESCAPGRSPA